MRGYKIRKKNSAAGEQNARKGLEFADVGCVLVAGRLVKAGHGKELLADPDMSRLFLGG